MDEGAQDWIDQQTGDDMRYELEMKGLPTGSPYTDYARSALKRANALTGDPQIDYARRVGLSASMPDGLTMGDLGFDSYIKNDVRSDFRPTTYPQLDAKTERPGVLEQVMTAVGQNPLVQKHLARADNLVGNIPGFMSGIGSYGLTRLRGAVDGLSSQEGADTAQEAMRADMEQYGNPFAKLFNVPVDQRNAYTQDPSTQLMEHVGKGFHHVAQAGSDLTGIPTSDLELALMLYGPKAAHAAVGAGRAGLKAYDRAYDAGLIPQPGMSIKDVTAAPRDALGFYSPAEQAALNMQRKQGPAQAFINDLMKGEHVRPEELEWMGVPEYLKNTPGATREDVQNYIAQNRIKLGERILGPEEGTAHAALYDNDQYKLPGGENYREVLLTLPDAVGERKTNLESRIAGLGSFIASREKIINAGHPQTPMMQDEIAAARKQSAAMQNELAQVGTPRTPFTGSHWKDPNVLAHLRLQDFTDVDRKKTLLVDELQSDWHQQGKEYGYEDASVKTARQLEHELSAITQRRSALIDQAAGLSDSEMPTFLKMNEEIKRLGAEATRVNEEWTKALETPKRIPNAPFKDTWHELGLKRAIKAAVDGGYDRVALTTGKRQIDRYSDALRANVDHIEYEPYVDDSGVKRYEIAGIKDGNTVVSQEHMTEAELKKAVGKNIFEKIVAGNGESLAGERPLRPGWMKIEGKDLSIGGEGMKTHYDEKYPGFFKRVAKQYGSTVGTTTLPTGTAFGEANSSLTAHELKAKHGHPDENMQDFIARMKSQRHQEPVHYLEITPAMREAVKSGLPMARGGKVHVADSLAAMKNELLG